MNKALKRFLIILFICIIVLACTVGILFYKYLQLDTSAMPVVSVKVNGTPISMLCCDYEISFLNGMFHKKISQIADVSLAYKTSSESRPQIIAEPENSDVHIKISDENGDVFDGSLQEYNSEFSFEKNGEYDMGALVEYSGEEGRITASYCAKIEIDVPLPVEVSVSRNKIAQGEAAVIKVMNLPDGVSVTGESALGYINFTQSEITPNAKNAIVPVGYAVSPGEYTVTVYVDDERFDVAVEVTEQSFEVQEMTISEEIADATVNSAAANAEFRNEIVPLYDTADSERYWYGNFVQPVQARVSTPYGVMRYVNGSTVPERHGGIDLAADYGTEIQCPNAGVVEYAGFLQLSGYTVVVEHGGGLKSYFYHMESINVNAGDYVEKGDIIGAVGSTGYSTGAHLHYEIKIGRNSLNPWSLFDGSSDIIKEDD